MSFALLRYQIKPRPLRQINLLSKVCYHGLQKGESELKSKLTYTAIMC